MLATISFSIVVKTQACFPQGAELMENAYRPLQLPSMTGEAASKHHGTTFVLEDYWNLVDSSAEELEPSGLL